MSKTPITVAQLIERLSQMDPAAVVMVKCDDDYYSGALTLAEIETGEAVNVGPHDWMGPPEDAYGKPIKPVKHHYKGGWQIEDKDLAAGGEILDRRPCLIIQTP